MDKTLRKVLPVSPNLMSSMVRMQPPGGALRRNYGRDQEAVGSQEVNQMQTRRISQIFLLSLIANAPWVAFGDSVSSGVGGAQEFEYSYADDVQIDSEPHRPDPEVFPVPTDTETPLDWWNVLILVNQNSPAGLEIVKMYREFHPKIQDHQVVYLSGLTDSASASATPADEIISRADFEDHIAQPVRDHMTALGIENRTYIIITTAGMPYRIEDTAPQFADVVMPAASDANLTVSNRNLVNAASVESELSLLFQLDPMLPEDVRAPMNGRLVNPYQGYRSSIKKWALDRDIPGRRHEFRWASMWRIFKGPLMEGESNGSGYAALGRKMSPADLYLVARLDGPRNTGEYPVRSVYEMLVRSAMVSNPGNSHFVGLSDFESVVAFDHSPTPPAPAQFAFTQIYNFPPQYQLLDYDTNPVPPGGEEYGTLFSVGNHYFRGHEWLTGSPATAGATGMAPVSLTLGATSFWDDTATILNGALVDADDAIIALQSYGRNGGDGRPAKYLLQSGPNGGPLFKCAPGAVFSSLESFNAVTMFLNHGNIQGKICEFIEMGGTGAVGHSFEPEGGAIIQSEFLLSNYLRDDDGDGIGDLTMIEAFYTGLPYLSWTEVCIGDPLTRLHFGTGSQISVAPKPGDATGDDYVGFADVLFVLGHFDSVLSEATYTVRADLDENGVIDGGDIDVILANYNNDYSGLE